MNESRTSGFRLALVLTALFSMSGASLADPSALVDWDQWRGPQRSGSVGGDGWPDSLDGLEPIWSVELGKGYPGPLVTERLVFVVETVDKKTVGVRALRRADGSEVWNTTWGGGGDVPFFAARNGDWVRSTPAWDGSTIYVGDMDEKLVALAGDSGKVRWTVDFPQRFATEIPDFGFASSPLVDGAALYVQAANSIVKLDRATGETVWRALSGSSEMKASGAFSSPVIATLAGVRQLVVLTRSGMNGVALDDGRLLWSNDVPNFRGMNILTPLIVGDRIFTSPYKNGSFMFEVSRDGDEFEIAQLWTNPGSGYMSSPVEVDGFIYMHLGNGRLSCLSVADGTERWRTSSFGKYWSMVRQGEKILALDSAGELVLLRADPTAFELLDRKEVSDREAWAHLAVRGDELFVRDLGSIRVFRWKTAAAR